MNNERYIQIIDKDKDGKLWNNLTQVRVSGCRTLYMYKRKCLWLEIEVYKGEKNPNRELDCPIHDRKFYFPPCIECVEEQANSQEIYFYDNS